jgi:serine/threonine protein kinase
VTRKKYESTLENDFDEELHILSSLRCLKHPNIIKLITAYTKGQSYNFLLPVADGDLADFLFSKYQPPYFQSGDEILASLWGLSSAVEAVHEYFADDFNVRQIGCHYDIKPGNILCQSGRFLLSDFGLSRLRPEEDGSRSLFKQGEGCYLAPECEPSDRDFKPGRIGRASDIWSFGCVLAEILAYLSACPGERHARMVKFHEDRKIKLGPFICYHFHGVDGINPAVTEFLDGFSAQSSSPETFRSLALLIREILQFDPELRPKAPLITRRLFHMSQRVTFKAICSTLECRLRSMDLGLLIELERLKIWGDAVGLTSETYQVQDSTWCANSHSHREYQSMQDILQQCLAEANFIADQLDRNSNPPYRLSYHLQKLQDILWDMQPIPVLQYMTSRLEEQILDKGNTTVLQEAQISFLESTVGDLSERRVDYQRVAHLATMKEIASSIIQQGSSNQDLSVDKLSFRPPVTELHRYFLKTAEDTGRRVLIEIIEYKEAVISRVNELVERVNSIASLRSRGTIKDVFPVLECKGYYHDASHFNFGVVYELPQFAENTDPLNLVQVIDNTKSRLYQPSLTMRFKLASTLVSHVLSFHRGGWLHKNICAFNIIFFPKVFKTLAESFSSPYFIGFNHSRLNDENAFSVLAGPEEDYQHPVYLRNSEKYSDDPKNPIRRFRQEFDYYSVGLVLLEIALWKPLNKIIGNILGSPENVQAQLLKSHISLVKAYMGDCYGEAVKSCLSCYVADERSPEEVREEFNSKVVTPLSQCSL